MEQELKTNLEVYGYTESEIIEIHDACSAAASVTNSSYYDFVYSFIECSDMLPEFKGITAREFIKINSITNKSNHKRHRYNRGIKNNKYF